MANSSIVTSLKDKVIYELTHDDAIFEAINPPDTSLVENGGDLINTHIFRYNKNPNTITNASTFLTIMVNTNSRDRLRRFVTPTLIISIYTHNKHMDVNNIPGIMDSRNDYIAKLIDHKFNGYPAGAGTLALVSNIEDTYNNNFLFRRLTFDTIDVNASMCGTG